MVESEANDFMTVDKLIIEGRAKQEDLVRQRELFIQMSPQALKQAMDLRQKLVDELDKLVK